MSATSPSSRSSARPARVHPVGADRLRDEVARVIAFLLSADAGYMTGQAVNVSGGLVTY